VFGVKTIQTQPSLAQTSRVQIIRLKVLISSCIEDYLRYLIDKEQQFTPGMSSVMGERTEREEDAMRDMPADFEDDLFIFSDDNGDMDEIALFSPLMDASSEEDYDTEARLGTLEPEERYDTSVQIKDDTTNSDTADLGYEDEVDLRSCSTAEYCAM